MAMAYVLMYSVAFVGVPTENGFRALGSCFFLAQDAGEGMVCVYVVTCRHLVRAGATHLRIGKREAAPVQIEVPLADWLFPKDDLVDLAIAPFNVAKWDSTGDLLYAPVWVPEGIFASGPLENFMLIEGDELLIPGLFAPHPGELQNIAVMRRATIAAMPTEPLRYASPRHPPFLIESRSLGGASGSPVFVDLDPNRGVAQWLTIGPERRYKLPFLLLGMLLKSHAGDYADDFDGGVEFADAQFNAGISVVMPIWIVNNFLESSEMAAARTAAVETDQRRVGFFHPISSTRKGGNIEPVV
jgi:hypothetical protein